MPQPSPPAPERGQRPDERGGIGEPLRPLGGPDVPTSGETEPIVLSRGNLFCVVNREGNIAPAGARDLGLFREDTRHLSHLELLLLRGRPTVLSAETQSSSHSQIDLTVTDQLYGGFFEDPRNVLHIRRRQLLEDDEYVERLTATNHLRRPMQVELSLCLEADFADIFEIRGARRKTRGTLLVPERGADHLVFAYRGTDGDLYRTVVRIMPEPTSFDGMNPQFVLMLEPGETTVLELVVMATRGEPTPTRGHWRAFDERVKAITQSHQSFLDGATRVSCDNNRFEGLLHRSLSDIDSLRLRVADRTIVGAGIPWFAAPFGRDAIITSFSCLSVAPDLACETLRTLAAFQGERDDPWREEEPGKIFHELRRGELARAGEIPHSPYYGTIDATPLWLILLGEAYRWTGDEKLWFDLEPHAERALAWIERRLEQGGGLLRYQRSHNRGLENQGWKDSRDGVSYPDGTIAQPPIALVEVQGYVVGAFEAMAGLRRRRGDGRGAARLRERARVMRHRIERDFWVDATRYYALARDGSDRRVETITSNPGHLAFCRALPSEKTARLAEVLLGSEMYTGWGIRTLARGQAVFNPISYHNGTVWPHDNALCGLGLAQTGHLDEAIAIVEGLYAASLHFRDMRLPELFCGMSRGEGDSLVHYPVSCSPQAWASAAFFLLLQATLGIRPDAHHHRLTIRNPRLPNFMRRFDYDHMRVGHSFVSLHFERQGDRTYVDLVRVDGDPSLKVAIEIG